MNVRRAYVAALVVVALLATASFVLLDRLIVAQGKTATIINVAGRQRMLSQRITGLGQSLARQMSSEADISEQLMLRHEISGAIGLLESSHIALVYGDKTRALPGINSTDEIALFYSEPHRVDDRIKEFSKAAYALLEAETAIDAQQKAERLGELGYGDILISLGEVVSHLEQKAQHHGQNVERIHLAMLLATMLILLGEAVLIFRPMEVQLQRSIERIRQSKAELKHASRHDPLTQLCNRQFLREVIRSLEAGTHPSPHAIVSIDLDRFKAVNDVHGHAKGDELLIEFAAAMKNVLRDGDQAFRIGGDEFVLLLAVDHDETEARMVCQRIAEELGKVCRADAAFSRVTASFGATLWPEGQSFHDALIESDIALYEAKGAGRNRIVLFEDWMRQVMDRRSETEAMIDSALEGQRFEPHFQPQIDMRTGRLIGLEVLARLKTEDDGETLTPDRFISVAERTGQIVPLGKQIIEKALAHAIRWQDADAPLAKLSVNASASQILDEDFLPFLTNLLEVTGYPAEKLTIEVLESVMLDGVDTGIVKAVERLRELGITIELDDFGMGHTSIANVTSLGANRIKIDRSFIATAIDDDSTRHVLKAMIAMADAMKIEVLAEGIETALQQNLLVGMGCVYGQGYHFAHPMDAGAFDDWFAAYDESDIVQQASLAVALIDDTDPEESLPLKRA